MYAVYDIHLRYKEEHSSLYALDPVIIYFPGREKISIILF
jgi:hypothetical protein